MIPAELQPIYQELGPYTGKLIHIAGSKGKGTTAHLLAKLLEWNGHKVGLFTSPHILEENEMIQVNGEPILSEDLLDRKKRLGEHWPELSDFEQTALVALRYFEEEHCDYVVLECGWGGAKDATNVVDSKILTLLAHVELEHTAILGNTLAAIAREQLGICRNGVPLLSSKQKDEVQATVEEVRPDVIWTKSIEAGYHHPESAGLAVAAAKQLGVQIDLERLASVQLPGRFEVVHDGGRTFILDGAHTLDSVAYAKKQIEDYFEGQSVFWGVHFLKDKDPSLVDLFSQEKSVWIELEDERAGRCPEGWTSMKMEEFLKKGDTHVGILGSFKLVGLFDLTARSRPSS